MSNLPSQYSIVTKLNEFIIIIYNSSEGNYLESCLINHKLVNR